MRCLIKISQPSYSQPSYKPKVKLVPQKFKEKTPNHNLFLINEPT